MTNKRLSVVVPMFNVQEFLGEALDSLLKQGLQAGEVQIILIDAGSTDGTLTIANDYVVRYPDFFEVHQFENAGLGAARNRGTRLANADYIAYLDPDDIIPDNTYSFLLDIIERTESEIITGNVRRFNENNKIWVPELHRRSILGDFENTTLNDHPELIWDASSWNKIFKLSFLRENNLYFPEGVLYEDFPMVNPAFAKAKSIDVTTRVVYMWRVRSGSITNKSTGAQATRDRIKVNKIALDGLNTFDASDEVKQVLIQKALNMGILAMLRKEHYDLIPLEERHLLFEDMKSYLMMIPEKDLSSIKFENQVYFRKIKDVENFVEFDRVTSAFLKGETNYFGEWVEGNWTLFSNISTFNKPAADLDFQVNTKIQKVYFDGDVLHISGYAYAKYSDMSKSEYITNASIYSVDNQKSKKRLTSANIVFFENKNITAKFGYNDNHFAKDGADFNYDYSGYQISIPLRELINEGGTLGLFFEFEVDNQRIQTEIKNPISGLKTRPETMVSTALKSAFDIEYDTETWDLYIKTDIDVPILRYEKGKYLIDNFGAAVFLQKNAAMVNLELKKNELVLSKDIKKYFSRYDKKNIGKWNLVTNFGDVNRPVYFAGSSVNLDSDVFSRRLLANQGKARLEVDWFYPRVQAVSIENDVMTIDFSLNGWEAEATSVRVMADAKVPDSIWDTQRIEKGQYRVTIILSKEGFGAKPWLNFQILMDFADGYKTKQILKWENKDFDIQGKTISAGDIAWEFRWVIRNNGGFAVKRTADRTYREETGSFDRFLEVKYKDWLNEPILKDYVMMSSFWGRNNEFNDNPEAIYQYVRANYPSYTTIIMMKDAIREYPEYPNAKVVSYGTKEYWYYLARAKYFVNNVNYTEPQRIKRNGQVELQTMHGTPLKTLGFEVLDDWTDKTYNAVKRKNSNWDYLLTPSDWVAQYAKKVFEVNPQVVNSGYPRNDTLFKAYSAEDVNHILNHAKIPRNKKVIGYAPTWRVANKDTPISDYLDLEEFYDAIPEDTIVVLKNHHYENWIELPKQYSDKIINVTSLVSIEDLYIISDALITDYSSVMFDYILLDKPMMFYAFDYDDYVTKRGVNFDFRLEAPGPFVEEQADLEYWMNNVDKIGLKFADKINNFKRKFVQYDHGYASEIAVKTLLGNNN